MTRPIVIPILSLFLAGCPSSSSPTVAPNVTAQQQAFASRSMGLSFPAETRAILYYRAKANQGILPAPDDSINLKIELSSAALAKFLSQAPLSSAKWKNDHPQVYDVPEWTEWQPSKILKFRTEQFKLPNAQALNVLIDDDREDTKVIYLEWFET